MIQDAVVRNLEVVGEAAKQVPEALREQASELSWREMAGMRDELIHDYLGVDLNLVWDVVVLELPATRERIAALLEELGAECIPPAKTKKAASSRCDRLMGRGLVSHRPAQWADSAAPSCRTDPPTGLRGSGAPAGSGAGAARVEPLPG